MKLCPSDSEYTQGMYTFVTNKIIKFSSTFNDEKISSRATDSDSVLNALF